MFLVGLLVIANLVGGFLASSVYLTERIPSLKKVSDALAKFKIPIGLIVFAIAFVNIFNFNVGWLHYPKLSLISGLLVGFVLSVDILNKFDIDENTKNKLFNFASKYHIVIGLLALAIGIIKILKLFIDVVNIFL